MSGHVAVLGAGSWGTAFAKILADAGRDVTVLARRAAVAEAIRTGRHNPEYLPGIRLPERVTATGDAAEAIEALGAGQDPASAFAPLGQTLDEAGQSASHHAEVLPESAVLSMLSQ